MEVKSLVVIVSLVVLISVHSSDAINCWTCTSATLPNCGANFNETGMTSTQCPLGDVSCVIVTQNNVVTRTCGSSKRTEGCTTVASVETCYCNTDECISAAGGGGGGSAAMIPTVSLVAVGFGVLLKIIF